MPELTLKKKFSKKEFQARADEILGREVRVAVLGIRGNQVRLGIEAPKEMTVLRDELWSAADNQGKDTH